MTVNVKITLDVSPDISRLKDGISGECIAGVEKSVRQHVHENLLRHLDRKVSEKINIRCWDTEGRGRVV